jgi:tRNA-binding protein
MQPTIDFNDFQKVEMRVGTITDARANPKTHKPSYVLTIDFGELGTRKSSAQITDLYEPEALIDQQVICVVNFPPKQIANVMSECLVLGVSGKNDQIVLLSTERPVENGTRVH